MNQDNALPQDDPMDILSTPLEKQFLRKVASPAKERNDSGFESIGSYIASNESLKNNSQVKEKSSKKTLWLTILLIAILGVAGSLLYFQQNPAQLDNLTAKITTAYQSIQTKTAGIFNATTMPISTEITETTTPTQSEIAQISSPVTAATPATIEATTQPETKLDNTALSLGETQGPIAISVQPTDPLEQMTEQISQLQYSITMISIQIRDITTMRAREIQAQAELASLATAPTTGEQPALSVTVESPENTDNIAQLTAQIEAITAEIQSLTAQATTLATE